jgi:hypothetical protein
VNPHNPWTEWRKNPRLRAIASAAMAKVTAKLAGTEKSIEQLQAEDANTQVVRGGVPVVWSDPSGRRLRGKGASIVTPDGKQVSNFAVPPNATCAECAHFNITEGRKEIVRQKFAERLVLEEEWALRHLGGSIDHMGLCGRANGDLATLTMSPACDGFKPRGK